MSLAVLSPESICELVCWDDASQSGSVLDAIQLVTTCKTRGAFARVLNHILDSYPYLRPEVTFDGKPRAPLSTLLEIAWLCPGTEKDFRRTGAAIMCRALGGHPSLVDKLRTYHSHVATRTNWPLFDNY